MGLHHPADLDSTLETDMRIKRSAVVPIAFEGLEILDFTAGTGCSSSIAEVLVPPGATHRTAWSRRSDKYYYVIGGSLSFTLGDEVLDLEAGDVCVVPKGERFSYRNATSQPVRLLLLHSPSFDLSREVFEDDRD